MDHDLICSWLGLPPRTWPPDHYRLLGLEPIDWLAEGLDRRTKSLAAEKEAKKKKETVRRSGTHPAHPLEEYAGDYQHPG